MMTYTIGIIWLRRVDGEPMSYCSIQLNLPITDSLQDRNHFTTDNNNRPVEPISRLFSPCKGNNCSFIAEESVDTANDCTSQLILIFNLFLRRGGETV